MLESSTWGQQAREEVQHCWVLLLITFKLSGNQRNLIYPSAWTLGNLHPHCTVQEKADLIYQDFQK